MRKRLELDPKTRILIIEDMPLVAQILEGYLESMGFSEFISCPDAMSGWWELRSKRPQFELILCDWTNPKSGGQEFWIRYQESAFVKKSSLIFMVLPHEIDEVMRKTSNRAFSYLQKPFQTKDLSALITVKDQP